MRITIRLTEQDAEKLQNICDRRGLQMSEAVRMLLRDNCDQAEVADQIRKVQEAMAALHNKITEEKHGEQVKVQSGISEETITKLLNLIARNYLAVLQLARKQGGENMAISVDAIACKNSAELLQTGTAKLKAF